VHAAVTYFQPESERWREQTARVQFCLDVAVSRDRCHTTLAQAHRTRATPVQRIRWHYLGRILVYVPLMRVTMGAELSTIVTVAVV